MQRELKNLMPWSDGCRSRRCFIRFLEMEFQSRSYFLGDSGAYLVGLVLAAISITGVIKGAAAATISSYRLVFLVLLILFFPLLDTAWAIVRRAARGKSVFEPDRQHIHHRLLDTALSTKENCICYLFSFYLLWFSIRPTSSNNKPISER